MNKYLKIALAGAAMFAMSAPAALAQGGAKSIGMNVGYASYNKGAYVDFNFQYSFAKHLRISPSIGHAFRNDHVSGFLMNADLHFPFTIAKGADVYPLVGLALQNWEYGDNYNTTRGGVNFGTGFDFYLTNNFKMTLQGKYTAADDTGGAFLGMGFGYVF